MYSCTKIIQTYAVEQHLRFSEQLHLKMIRTSDSYVWYSLHKRITLGQLAKSMFVSISTSMETFRNISQVPLHLGTLISDIDLVRLPCHDWKQAFTYSRCDSEVQVHSGPRWYRQSRVNQLRPHSAHKKHGLSRSRSFPGLRQWADSNDTHQQGD